MFRGLLGQAIEGIVRTGLLFNGAGHSETYRTSSEVPEPPGGGTRASPAAAGLTPCSPQNLAYKALTCSPGPGAALAWGPAPETSRLGLPEGPKGCALAFGALAVAAQARGQMHLRGSGKGLHLREPKESLNLA